MKRRIWITALAALTLGHTAHAQDDSGSNNGDPVSPDMRQEMEQKIGADVSDVRVHTDSNAATMSDQLNSQAYTTGNDVHLGPRGSGPQSGDRRLLAHELTHVVQQGGPGGQNSTASEEEDPQSTPDEARDRRGARRERNQDRRRDRNPD
jgi:hypothetical protein